MKYYLIKYTESTWDTDLSYRFTHTNKKIVEGQNPVEAFESLKESADKFTNIYLDDIKEI